MNRIPLELLTGIPAVLAAQAEGSATRAAERLGTTAATVLRRIDAVEAALGVRLFERLPTGLSGTAALAAVLPWAEQCAASVDGMRREVAGLDPAPAGVVRIAAPPTVASHLLVPLLPALRVRHPAITVEFASANAVVDLAQREADLALRVIRPASGDLVLRRVADYQMVVAGAPGLLGGQASLASLPWVSWDRTMDHIPEARWLAQVVPDARIAMRASDLNTLLHAAQAGVGAVLVAEPIAAVAGGLVRLPVSEVDLPSGSLWLVAHRALRRVPRVDAVWSWVEAFFDAGPPDNYLLPEG